MWQHASAAPRPCTTQWASASGLPQTQDLSGSSSHYNSTPRCCPAAGHRTPGHRSRSDLRGFAEKSFRCLRGKRQPAALLGTKRPAPEFACYLHPPISLGHLPASTQIHLCMTICQKRLRVRALQSNSSPPQPCWGIGEGYRTWPLQVPPFCNTPLRIPFRSGRVVAEAPIKLICPSRSRPRAPTTLAVLGVRLARGQEEAGEGRRGAEG